MSLNTHIGFETELLEFYDLVVETVNVEQRLDRLSSTLLLVDVDEFLEGTMPELVLDLVQCDVQTLVVVRCLVVHDGLMCARSRHRTRQHENVVAEEILEGVLTEKVRFRVP